MARKYGPDDLTTAQAAVVLGIGTETLRRWTARGLGPPHLPAKRSRYRRSDLLAYLRAARVRRPRTIAIPTPAPSAA